jgi:hypothetical protein
VRLTPFLHPSPRENNQRGSYFGSRWISSLLIFTLSFGLLTTVEAPQSKAVTSIEFEALSPGLVILGSLASRSQNKQLTKSGAAVPYTMTGRDGITNLTYQYQTDQNYSTTATLRESDERPGSSCVAGSGIGSYSGTTSGTDTGKTGVIQLTSTGNVCQ